MRRVHLNSRRKKSSLLLFVVLFAASISSCADNSRTPNPTPVRPESTVEIGDEPEYTISTFTPPTPIPPINDLVEHITFSTGLYELPGGLFSMQLPRDWPVEQGTTRLTATDPESGSSLIVQIVHPGKELDLESLDTYINAREDHDFEEYENVIEIERRADAEKNLVTTINVVTLGGQKQTLMSSYQLREPGLVFVDFLYDQDDYSFDLERVQGLIETVDIDQDLFAKLPKDASEYPKIVVNSYYSFESPTYWFNEKTTGENSVVETVSSPDRRAVAQIILYDDGQPINRRVAGEIALTALRDHYTHEITVTGDRVLTGGKEELSWKSEDGAYQGVTIFWVNDSALFILTKMWEQDAGNDYQVALDEILGSFEVAN